MAFKTLLPHDRVSLTGMAIITTLLVRRMHYIADKMWTVTAMRVVTGIAFPRFFREIWMLGNHGRALVTIPAQFLHVFNQ
jgi:hypothetical protein